MFWGSNLFSPTPEQFLGRVFDPECSLVLRGLQHTPASILLSCPIWNTSFGKILSNVHFVSSYMSLELILRFRFTCIKTLRKEAALGPTLSIISNTRFIYKLHTINISLCTCGVLCFAKFHPVSTSPFRLVVILYA